MPTSTAEQKLRYNDLANQAINLADDVGEFEGVYR
jgi:hypothetical protein